MSVSGNAIAPAFPLDVSRLDNFNYPLGPLPGASDTVLNGLTEGLEASSDTGDPGRAGEARLAPGRGAAY
jgi:hypothetical protein